MGANPTFSVIIPAYQAETRIAAAMRSVLSQSEPDLELIVVDDGSLDATAGQALEVAGEDTRARVIRKPNGGTVSARNTGLDACSGTFIGLLDDDDLWLPQHLESVLPLLRDDRVGIAHADAWVADLDSGAVGRRTALERFAASTRRLPSRLDAAAAEVALLRVNFITTCACVFSRKAVERAGGFDPQIEGSDDWDLWLRIAGEGFGLARAPRAGAVLRKRADSAGSDTEMMARGALAVLRKARARGTLSRKADRVAARHARLVELDLWALSQPSRGGAALRKGTALARRAGRKRLPDHRSDRGPLEVQEALAAAARTLPRT